MNIEPRVGLMGNKPLGSKYMRNIAERAKRMESASSKQNNSPQIRLPYAPPLPKEMAQR